MVERLSNSIRSSPRSTALEPEIEQRLSIAELRVLRARKDVVAPSDASVLREPSLERFFGRPAAADELRLPQRTHHEAAEMRAAVSRLLSADTSERVGTGEALDKEERMRRVLVTIETTVEEIARKSRITL